MTNKQAKEILLRYVQAIPQDCITPTFLTALNTAISVLEERLQGEWITNKYGSSFCSICGTLICCVNYCPKCGAKMKKGGAE